MAAAPARPPAHRRLALLRAVLLLGGPLAGPAAVGALGPGACYGRARGPAPAQEPTTVRVRNQSFLDHNIYVISGGARSRLGTVAGNNTAVLRIPPSFVQPGALLRFLADPIGSNVTPVSEQITVSPGDEVTLIIPPR
jgi:hypothetical protein